MDAVKDLRGTAYCHVSKADRRVEFPASDGSLAIYTAESADSIRGEAFHIVVVDEAARVAEDVYYDVIVPTVADWDGDVILLSTPRGKNWYHTLFIEGLTYGKDGPVYSKRGPTTDNPNPNIQKAAVLAKQRLPENSYKQEWEAEFIADAFNPWLSEWYEGQNRFDPRPQANNEIIVGRWQSWDTGMKEKEDSAYSACVTVELTAAYRLRVRWVYRDKLSFPNLTAKMVDHAREWNRDGKLQGVIIEDKASGTSAFQTLRSSTEDWLSKLVIPFMPHGSKEQRADQGAVWGRNGMVELPVPCHEVPWLLDFEKELFEFPYSMYKDQVDALSQVILYLEHYLAAGLGLGRLVAA
jgi:phage terminase large subunit-like protein